MNIRLQLDLTEFDRFVTRFPTLVIGEMNDAIQKSAYKIESESKKEAPAVSGDLRRMINTTFSHLKGTIKANAVYSIYVHEGTKPHIIKVKNKKGLANKKKGQYFGPIVHHPGTKRNRFMLRAITNAEDSIIKYFGKALENVIKRA